MSKLDDTNEPMVSGPFRPVLCPDGVNAGKGYWIEDDKGIMVTDTRFYPVSEFNDAVTLCLLLNAAFAAGVESVAVAA